jgi:serine/threonine-protein kinase
MSDQIERLNSALQGRYVVERELGEGGMATVYLAEDMRHERRVALKVMRPELAAVLGAERFLAEIKTTAKLQHPHILPLFDSGRAEGFLFYVMPYVDGESLRARLDREHQLPVDEAVRIATHVAEALDYAHRHGVIHRDIKPANILIEDGQPVVGDFGIALAVGAASGDRLTETGLSLGTPHYMSPEQATGDQAVGPATDTYALGCVLHEMLVGEPPYTGSTAQAILGKIIAGAPEPVSVHRKAVPPHVEAVISRSLEKLPADRFTGAQQLVHALAEPDFRHGGPRGSTVEARAGGRLVLAWALVMTLIAIMAVWGPWRTPPATDAGAARFSTVPPSDQVPTGRIAFSPSGAQLAFTAGTGSSRALYLRSLDQYSARRVDGTEGARDPFFSPDGEWVGFFADRALKKVPVAGGDPQTLVDSVAGAPRGGSWGADGTIVFSAGGRGLMQVQEGGGAARLVAAPDPDAGEFGYAAPWVLPGGDGVLFTVISGQAWDATRVEIMSLRTGDRRVVAESGLDARYTSTGHVVYARNGSLYGMRFDASALEADGEPVLLLEDVRESRVAARASFGVSASGDLAYVPTAGGGWVDTLLWVDRSGASTPVFTAGGSLVYPDLSPDGNRVVVTTVSDEMENWIVDLRRSGMSRFTFEGDNHIGVWTPDGERIVFSSDRDGLVDLFWRRSDGAGEAELLYESPQHKDAGSWSPDGTLLAFAEASPETDWDVWVLSIESPREARPLLQSRFLERWPIVSPNGRWLAYASNESGRPEVNVIPFPGGGPRTQVSLGGGGEPLWGPDGRELFFRSRDSLMVVAVVDTTDFEVDRPALLFRGSYRRSGNFGRPGYDISPDGTRFLMIRGSEVDRDAPRINFVLNWLQEVEERLGN